MIYVTPQNQRSDWNNARRIGNMGAVFLLKESAESAHTDIT